MNIVEVECFAMFGFLIDIGGPQGPQGPPGRGLLLDDDENSDFMRKRLTEVGEPGDNDDAMNKSFL